MWSESCCLKSSTPIAVSCRSSRLSAVGTAIFIAAGQDMGCWTALRHANVVLQLRLLDAKYGTIVWSGMVEDVMTDQIPSSMIGELMNSKPDSPKGSLPDEHASKSQRLWKRPPCATREMT